MVVEEKLPFENSWKGQIIRSIAIDGCRTWEEVRDKTQLSDVNLNAALKELYDLGILSKTEEKEYRIEYKLYKQYRDYYKSEAPELDQKRTTIARTRSMKGDRQKDQYDSLVEWILTWKKANRLKFELNKSHFFLTGINSLIFQLQLYQMRTKK